MTKLLLYKAVECPYKVLIYLPSFFLNIINIMLLT